MGGGGEAGVLISVPDAGCGGGRWFSWQSQTLVVGGRQAVLMAVSDAGCGGG